MTIFKRVRVIVLAVSAAGGAMFLSGDIPDGSTNLVSRAEARIGRPLTPMSYAGVARRTTRRAAAVGAAGAAAAGAYYYYPQSAPGCVQAVNSYGQVVYRCPQ